MVTHIMDDNWQQTLYTSLGGVVQTDSLTLMLLGPFHYPNRDGLYQFFFL